MIFSGYKRLELLSLSGCIVYSTHNVSSRLRLTPLHSIAAAIFGDHPIVLVFPLGSSLQLGCTSTSILFWALFRDSHSVTWYHASSSLHEVFGPGLLLQWTFISSFSWLSHRIKASAALHEYFICSLAPQIKCTVGHFWTIVSVCCWPWGNTSQKFLPHWCLPVLNHSWT